ncbi:dentin sialophosphoprotein-like [Papaver somniferum]|uniref:dentin sialophosphoprotein-like n=1 Tax=Papaver somniferum TaxID=3469 RepID=UPI000E6FC219|nr:dentin sialophosphoprotein-like [Papaver somniferum]
MNSSPSQKSQKCVENKEQNNSDSSNYSKDQENNTFHATTDCTPEKDSEDIERVSNGQTYLEVLEEYIKQIEKGDDRATPESKTLNCDLREENERLRRELDELENDIEIIGAGNYPECMRCYREQIEESHDRERKLHTEQENLKNTKVSNSTESEIDYKVQIDKLKVDLDNALEKLKMLEKENMSLKTDLKKFDSSTKQLDSILDSGGVPRDMRGLGYKGKQTLNTKQETKFVKPKDYAKEIASKVTTKDCSSIKEKSVAPSSSAKDGKRKIRQTPMKGNPQQGHHCPKNEQKNYCNDSSKFAYQASTNYPNVSSRDSSWISGRNNRKKKDAPAKPISEWSLKSSLMTTRMVAFAVLMSLRKDEKNNEEKRMRKFEEFNKNLDKHLAEHRRVVDELSEAVDELVELVKSKNISKNSTHSPAPPKNNNSSSPELSKNSSSPSSESSNTRSSNNTPPSLNLSKNSSSHSPEPLNNNDTSSSRSPAQSETNSSDNSPSPNLSKDSSTETTNKKNMNSSPSPAPSKTGSNDNSHSPNLPPKDSSSHSTEPWKNNNSSSSSSMLYNYIVYKWNFR